MLLLMRYLVLLAFSFSCLFAIIDIASIDFGDKEEGLSGSVYGSFQTKRGNTNREEAEYGGRLEYDTNKSITWIQGSAEHDTASGYTTDDNAFVHLRHIHQIQNPSWAAEVYYQIKQNQFKNLNKRSLIGAGLRYKVFDSHDYGKLFFGLSAMDEKITYNEVDPDEHNSRASAYFSYGLDITKAFELSYLGYYQTKFDNSSDYLTSSMVEMTIHLTKVFDLSYVLEFDYDAAPALNIHNTDTRQRLSFIYRFGVDDPLSAYAQTVLYKDEAPEVTTLKPQSDRSEKKGLEGKWSGEDGYFIVSSDFKGVYRQNTGMREEGFVWKMFSTDKKNETEYIDISFVDEAGKTLRTEHYLYSRDTLVGLQGNSVKVFKR